MKNKKQEKIQEGDILEIEGRLGFVDRREEEFIWVEMMDIGETEKIVRDGLKFNFANVRQVGELFKAFRRKHFQTLTKVRGELHKKIDGYEIIIKSDEDLIDKMRKMALDVARGNKDYQTTWTLKNN